MLCRSILLIEDNPDDERLTIRALRRSQIVNPITVAHDGEEAIRMLTTVPALPGLVMLDLKLPKLNGLEVLQTIRTTDRTRLLPVVVLTSSNEAQDIVQCYRLGANGYVQKPVDFDQFTNAVSQLGRYWLLINEPLPEGVEHYG